VPDLDPLSVQRLEQRRRELVRRHELLMERGALLPDGADRRKLDDLTFELAKIDRQLRGVRPSTTA
jgi:hypothetical protein